MLPQAAEPGESGASAAQFVVQPDGTVFAVSLQARGLIPGSMPIATKSEVRDAPSPNHLELWL